MTPEVAVITRLSGIAAVAEIVGARIYNLKAPQQSATPYVRVQRISELTDYHARGADTLKRTRIQIDSCAAEASGVDPLAVAIDLAAAIEGDGAGSGLSGYRAALDAIEIAALQKVASRHDYEPDELRLVRVIDDYLVWWRPIAEA